MLLRADARHIPLADGTVQVCVTSPPYWGLRDYKLGDVGIGLEKTPEEFVANIVQVFREVRRVLRDDGTLWLNMGDAYAGNSAGGFRPGAGRADGIVDDRNQRNRNGNGCPAGLKPKDLVGIPWRVAFALQADGWYLRSDIIWHKPNPMPESVRDRPTKAHEYLFLLTKQARYYYDAEAIKEPVSDVSLRRAEYGWDCDRSSTKNASLGGNGIHTAKMGERFVNPAGRNRRDVWTIPTQPYKGAHFATYPEKLVEPCVLAGSRPGDVVLDPFCGSGTTGAVARRLGRDFVGLDMSAEYLELARKRIAAAPAGMGL
jgi:DNA modification methylase